MRRSLYSLFNDRGALLHNCSYFHFYHVVFLRTPLCETAFVLYTLMFFSEVCVCYDVKITKVLFLTDLKSRYDEEKSLRDAADHKLAKLNEQLQKEKQENERLQTELVQSITQ